MPPVTETIKSGEGIHPRAGSQSSPGVTFAHQMKLQKLPIPELEDTCRKYLAAVKPLVSQREYRYTENAVREFLRKDGPELQERLKRYAANKPSYIEQFWYDSYLNYDNPVVLNLNPFFLLEDDPTPARNNQINRASSLVLSACAFIRAVRREELPPDTIKGTPLCMDQYSRIFSTARIPTDHGCVMQSDHKSKHIVVLCRSQFYWFDILDDNSDIIMTEQELAHNLQAIINDSTATPIQEAAKYAMGILTTENRKVWAGLRDVLTRDGSESNNSECLSLVDRALFVLCLDSSSPTSGAELAMNMLCGTNVIEKGVQVGTCTNRWYDKLQIIVCKNGSAGINFEHTGVDGHTVLRMASDIYTDTILRFARTINGNSPSLWATQSPDPAKRDPSTFGDVSMIPHKLEWSMHPELATALRFAEVRIADLIQQNEFEVLEFAGYGKNFITSMGFSPDAFVQMAFQAAYFGLYGRVESTYEPAMTKTFLHGRTEAIRTVSDESVDFVRKFCADASPAEKVAALKAACARHTATTKECAKGLGQDRHLYALFCVWQRSLGHEHNDFFSDGEGSPDPECTNSNGTFSDYSDDVSIGSSPRSTSTPEKIPTLFSDASWVRLNTTILSTSNCGNPSLRLFGFGPTSADGFGIGYIIKNDSISICVSSKHRQTKRFIDTLCNYFMEIRQILKQVQKPRTTLATIRTQAQDLQSKAMRSGRVVPSFFSKNADDSDKSDTDTEDSDYGLGGYGYFDAGKSLGQLLATTPGHKHIHNKTLKRRHSIGRALRLAEY